MNQNQIGSDGVIDNWYTIASGIVDRYPLVKPFSPHDLGIAYVFTAKTFVGQGLTLRIEVKIVNYCVGDELFNLVLYANSTISSIETFEVAGRNSAVFMVAWNTTNLAKDKYVIKIEAQLSGDMHTDDNTRMVGTVTVTMAGDLNTDHTVDIFDIVIVANDFGRPFDPPLPISDPRADINNDGVVDIFDLVVVAAHFGETG